MERVVIAVVVVALAAAFALVMQRRRPDAPTQPTWAVPQQLDRADFVRPDAPWLVVVFTSATCDSCADAWAKAREMASDGVAAQEVELTAGRDLHRRYGIEAVPTVVVADAEGVVRATFLGPPTTSELWSTVARLRDEQDQQDQQG